MSEHSYTDRELRLIAEAVADEFIMSSLLMEGDEPVTDISITPRGRGIIGTFLMGASGLVAAVPLVGWILAPILVVLAKMGILEDYVADYLEGKSNITGLIEKLEKTVLGIVSKVPNVAIKPIADRVKRRVADEAGRKAIDVYVNNRTSTPEEANNLLATLYITDVVMEMMQKNIKLPKSVGKKAKIKLPTNRSGQGLIVINAQNLPSPYNFLHGIQGEIESEIVDTGDEAFKKAENDFEHPVTGQEDVIFDVDAEVIDPNAPQLPAPPRDPLQLPGPVGEPDDLDDLDLMDYLVADEDDDDITQPIVRREARYLQRLTDELEVISLINEIKYSGR